MDYAMLQKHHIQSVTDQEDYRYMGYIAAGAPTAVLPEQAAIWSYPVKGDDKNAVAFHMTSSMLQRIHLGGQITELDEECFNMVKEALACYKKIRSDIPCAIPFYPLGLPQYGADICCVAFACGDCIRLCVWCFQDAQTVTIPVEGDHVKILHPTDSAATVKMTDSGISIKFPQKYTSVVLEVEK